MSADQIANLEWFELPDGRLGFRGVLGRYKRQIVGDSRAELEKLAMRMAADLA